MATRYPLYVVDDGSGVNHLRQADSAYMTELNAFASYVHSVYPAVSLSVGSYAGNPNLLSGFPISDTYYIAGAYTTRVDRFSTEAETPNISQSSTAYNSIIKTVNAGSSSTADPTGMKFPLYLQDDGESGASGDVNRHLKCMTGQDFKDTFVTPILNSLDFYDGGTGPSNGGVYFISSSTTVSGAARVSATPIYSDTIANIAAYTSGGIPETQYQPSVVNNYYLFVVRPTSTDFPLVYDNLPLYLDPNDEQIKQHTPTTWSNLLGPFIQAALYDAIQAGTLNVNYSINGSGNTMGTIMADTRRVPTGTGYTQRYVGLDDYRTQEFPNGTPVVISQHTFKMSVDNVSLEGTTSSPETNGTPRLSDGTVGLGWQFTGNGAITNPGAVSQFDSDASPQQSTTGHLPWHTPSSQTQYYFRFSIYAQSDVGSQTLSGTTLNTWVSMPTGISLGVYVNDNRAANSYGAAYVTWKVEIATDSGGTNIVATGYYRSNYEGGA